MRGIHSARWFVLAGALAIAQAGCLLGLDTATYRDVPDANTQGDSARNFDATVFPDGEPILDATIGRDSRDRDATIDPTDATVGRDAMVVPDAVVSADVPITGSDAITRVDVFRHDVASTSDVPCTSAMDDFVCPPIPSTCPEIEALLVDAYAAAIQVPCCGDLDCTTVITGDLCCAAESFVVPSHAALCAQALAQQAALLVSTGHEPCPGVCTNQLCATPIGAVCVQGVCSASGATGL